MGRTFSNKTKAQKIRILSFSDKNLDRSRKIKVASPSANGCTAVFNIQILTNQKRISNKNVQHNLSCVLFNFE